MSNIQIQKNTVLPDTVSLSVHRILHGDDELFLPYVCALSHTPNLRDAFCTGVLIAPNAVISASHCVADNRNIYVLFVQKNTSDVVSGVFRVLNIYIPRARVGREEQIGDQVTGLLDTCVLFLDEYVPSHISEPCALEINTQSSGEALIVGFGMSKIVYDVAKELASQPENKGLSLNTIMDMAERRLRDYTNSTVKKRSALMVFSKDKRTGLVEINPNQRKQSQYQGDSGGPVFIRDNNGNIKLFATTSYGSEGGLSQNILDSYVNTAYSCPVQTNLFFINSAFKKQQIPSDKYFDTGRSLTDSQILEISMDAIPFSMSESDFMSLSEAEQTSGVSKRIRSLTSRNKKNYIPYVLIPAALLTVCITIYAATRDSE